MELIAPTAVTRLLMKQAFARLGQEVEITEAQFDAAAQRTHASEELGLPVASETTNAVTVQAIRSIDPATGELATWFGEPIACQDAIVWQPAHMTQAARDAARSIAARITNSIGGQGLFSVELEISGDDALLHRCIPGPTRAGEVTLGTQRRSQYELHARAVLGLPIDVTLTTPGAATRNVPLRSALTAPESDAIQAEGESLAYVSAETTEEAREALAGVS